MKRKCLIGIAVLCFLFATLVLAGCGGDENQNNNNIETSGNNSQENSGTGQGNNESGANTPDSGGEIIPDVENASEGLEFELNENGTYTLIGRGNCTDTEIVIPARYNETLVTRIGDWAFEEQYDITRVVIPNSVTSIGDSSFWRCENLTEIVIPNSVTTFEYGAFECCIGLTEINIPDSVTTIGPCVFYGCENLKEIEISANVENIGYGAFLECYALSKIIVDENNLYYQSIDGNLYSKDGKTMKHYSVGKTEETFTIPNHVTTLETYVFEASKLTEIIIPDGIQTIGWGAFSSCKKLIYNEENGLKYLGNSSNPYLFLVKVGDDLTKARINDNCKFIGSYSFTACNNLTEVYISKNIKDIDAQLFSYCGTLSMITVDEANAYYQSIDGNLYTKDGETLLVYPRGKKEACFIIPDGVKRIGRDALCGDLTGMVICESVEEIDIAACNGGRVYEVYYKGMESDWEQISIGEHNEGLMDTPRYYYIENETDVPNDNGNYWHYVNGVPTEW